MNNCSEQFDTIMMELYDLFINYYSAKRLNFKN